MASMPPYLYSVCFLSQILSKAKQNHKLTLCANTHVIRVADWSRRDDAPPPLAPDWTLSLSLAGAAS